MVEGWKEGGSEEEGVGEEGTGGAGEHGGDEGSVRSAETWVGDAKLLGQSKELSTYKGLDIYLMAITINVNTAGKEGHMSVLGFTGYHHSRAIE